MKLACNPQFFFFDAPESVICIDKVNILKQCVKSVSHAFVWMEQSEISFSICEKVRKWSLLKT